MAVTANHSIPILAEGQGGKEVDINSGFAIIDAILGKRFALLTLCLGTTVAGTGVAGGEVPVPFSPVDGTSSIVWNVRRINLRANNSSTLTGTFQKSTVAGAFSAATIGTVALAAAHENANTTTLGTVASGDKVRLNISAYTSGGGGLVAQVLLEEA
jgi:hypothetical protein